MAQPSPVGWVVAVHACVVKLSLAEWIVVGHGGRLASASLAQRVLRQDALTEALAVLGSVAALCRGATVAVALPRVVGALGLGRQSWAAWLIAHLHVCAPFASANSSSSTSISLGVFGPTPRAFGAALVSAPFGE